MAEETCGSCRFWRAKEGRTPDEQGDSDCRRNAPVAAPWTEDGEYETNYVIWPVTLDTEWCGEWQERGE